MNNYSNIYLALRVFALFIVIISYDAPLQFFLMYLESFNDLQDTKIFSSELNTTVLASIPLIIGVFIWVRAEKLAPLFTTRNSSASNSSNEYPLATLRVACIIAGLYLIINNLPFLASNYFIYSGLAYELGFINNVEPSQLSSLSHAILTQAIAILFGTLLILGSNILSRWLNKIKTFGLEK